MASRGEALIGTDMSENTDDLTAAIGSVPNPAGGDVGDRIAAPRLKDGIASIVLDATGLNAAQRAGLERQLRAAALAVPASPSCGWR